MSGTCWFWQFYDIMFCYTLEFWGFTCDWHPLFQISNSSPGMHILTLNNKLKTNGRFQDELSSFTCRFSLRSFNPCRFGTTLYTKDVIFGICFEIMTISLVTVIIMQQVHKTRLSVVEKNFILNYIFEISGFHWSKWAIDCLIWKTFIFQIC